MVKITSAGLSVWLQAVASGAGAEVAALGVLTQEVTGLWRRGAFVHIWNTQKTREVNGRPGRGTQVGRASETRGENRSAAVPTQEVAVKSVL